MNSKLENQNIEKKVDEIFEPIMIIVTVVLIFILGIPALYTLSSVWQEIFKITDLIIWVVVTPFVHYFVTRVPMPLVTPKGSTPQVYKGS